MKPTINPIADSQIEIIGELPAEKFESYRKAALGELNKDVAIDGFRPGHVPESVLIQKLGEEKILYEMARLALADFYPEFVMEEKIDVIGRPEITITKIAAGNPLGYKITTAVMPTVKLGKYQDIAKKINAEPEAEVKIEDADVDKVLDEIKKSRATKQGEEMVLPELTDDFAKTLGNFETLLDLKIKIRENLTEEKKRENAEKRRLKIVEEISQNVEVPIPPVLVESELDKMISELRIQIEHMGLKFDEYLTHIKKTPDDMKAEWGDDAKKRVKTGLILNEIARAENVKADPEKLEHEMKHFMSHYPEAEPERVRAYVESVLVHEATFAFLESLK